MSRDDRSGDLGLAACKAEEVDQECGVCPVCLARVLDQNDCPRMRRIIGEFGRAREPLDDEHERLAQRGTVHDRNATRRNILIGPVSHRVGDEPVQGFCLGAGGCTQPRFHHA